MELRCQEHKPQQEDTIPQFLGIAEHHSYKTKLRLERLRGQVMLMGMCQSL